MGFALPASTAGQSSLDPQDIFTALDIHVRLQLIDIKDARATREYISMHTVLRLDQAVVSAGLNFAKTELTRLITGLKDKLEVDTESCDRENTFLTKMLDSFEYTTRDGDSEPAANVQLEILPLTAAGSSLAKISKNS